MQADEMRVTYHAEGDYLLPDLTAPEPPNIGVWGARRRQYLRKAKRAIIKNAHTERKSEADRRLPKGERGRQIAAVRKLVREARANGTNTTLRKVCMKIWTPLKSGYPSIDALYNYCHRHESEF